MSAYDPAKRTFCVDTSAWTYQRRVRILHPAFGHLNRIGTIHGVSDTYVFVRVSTGKKIVDKEVIAYEPGQLRLLDRKRK